MDVLLVGIYCAAMLAWLWGLRHLRPARSSPLTAPVHHPSADGPVTAGAGAPDPAPVVAPRRVRIEMGGLGRHRAA